MHIVGQEHLVYFEDGLHVFIFSSLYNKNFFVGILRKLIYFWFLQRGF
jgi:hypothetical protein